MRSLQFINRSDFKNQDKDVVFSKFKDARFVKSLSTGATPFSITTFSITKLSIMTISLSTTVSSVIVLNVIMLNVVMLNAIMVSVASPFYESKFFIESFCIDLCSATTPWRPLSCSATPATRTWCQTYTAFSFVIDPTDK